MLNNHAKHVDKKTRAETKRIILLSAIIAAVPLSIGIVGIFINITSSIRPVNDDDLIIQREENIPDEENAISAFYQAAEKTYIPNISNKTDDLKYQKKDNPDTEDNEEFYFMETFQNMVTYQNSDSPSSKSWDEIIEHDIIDNNTEAFNTLEQALAKPRIQIPEITSFDPFHAENSTVMEDVNNITIRLRLPTLSMSAILQDPFPYDQSFPELANMRMLALMKIVQARSIFRNENQKQGIEEVFKIIRVGDEMQKAQGATLSHYITGSVIKRNGLNTLVHMASESSLENIDIQKYIQRLNEYAYDESVFIDSFKQQYMLEAQLIDNISTGTVKIEDDFKTNKNILFSNGVPSSQDFNPNSTKQMFTRWYRFYIHELPNNCTDMNDIIHTKLDLSLYKRNLSDPGQFLDNVVSSNNALGKDLLEIFPNDYDYNRIPLQKCSENFAVTGAQVVLALKSYYTDTGDHPPTLNDLVPQYLDSIPLDLYDGTNIKYRDHENTDLEKIVFTGIKTDRDSFGYGLPMSIPFDGSRYQYPIKF